MTISKQKQVRILAVSPSTRGLGFAILDGENTLADWGIKTIARGKSKNVGSLAKVERLIGQARPDVLVMENTHVKDSHRSQRMRELFEQVATMAKTYNLRVRLISRRQVMDAIIPHGEHTKQEVAEAIAKTFPKQLESQLPQKRKVWQAENYHMPVFDAVALALAFSGGA